MDCTGTAFCLGNDRPEELLPRAVRLGFRFFWAITVGLGVLGVVSSTAGQEQPLRTSMEALSRRTAPGNTQAGRIRVSVNVVLVPALVTDTYDRPVLGLQKDAFRLYEDGVEQDITHFFRQDRPMSVGILFDASGSMARKMDQSRGAISKFLGLSMPGDEFFLFKFADRPEQLCAFKKDAQEIVAKMTQLRPSGWTALFDAIYLGMHRMKRAHNDRKALLILSDGGDNNSRYSEQEVRTMVQEGDVRIFAISIQDRSPALEKLANESGGRAFRIQKLEDLEDAAAKVSEQLHSEYVLGYVPKAQVRDGMYRKLKVETVTGVTGSLLHTSWRHGYYGPAE